MNRHGFSLSAMIGFCCLLGCCLLTSAFFYQELIGKKFIFSFSMKPTYSNKVLYRMENNYSDVSTLYIESKEYIEMENRLKQSAQIYTQKYSSKTENKLVITLRTMQLKKIIDNLYDSKGNLCNGYVIYDSSLGLYTPYLKCGSYKSIDYVNRLE